MLLTTSSQTMGERPWMNVSTEELFTLLSTAKRRVWELGTPREGEIPSAAQRAAREETEALERELLIRDEI